MSEFYGDPGEDTEARRQSIGRILGDPTLYPEDFRAWLKRFIESSGITIPYTSIQGKPPPGDGSITIDGVPPGTLLAFGGPNPVLGNAALVCNGQAVSRETFALLFDVIGITYGQGDGSTTFNVPDIQDRALYMRGSKVTMGGNEGQPLGVRGPNHHHSATLSGSMSGGTNDTGGHSHPYTEPSWETVEINIGQTSLFAYPQRLNNAGASTGGGGSHSHSVNVSGSVSGNTSGGGAVDAPGYLGVMYVIVTGL